MYFGTEGVKVYIIFLLMYIENVPNYTENVQCICKQIDIKVFKTVLIIYLKYVKLVYKKNVSDAYKKYNVYARK